MKRGWSKLGHKTVTTESDGISITKTIPFDLLPDTELFDMIKLSKSVLPYLSTPSPRLEKLHNMLWEI